MVVMKENERLYPASWEYNACRITTELAKIFENNGADVKPATPAIISNRTADNAISEYAELIRTYEEHLNKTSGPERRARLENAIRENRERLEREQSAPNGPVTVTHPGYISAALDGIYYYFETDRNPLFPQYYLKTPIRDGKRSRDACLEETPKDFWMHDCFITGSASNADIKEAANLLFNFLTGTAPQSTIRRDKSRKRVANIYNDGWHWETVYSPERMEKLDFLTD